MSHIFISHVEEDADVTLEIALGLEEAAYKTWSYEIDSIPGPSYLLQTGQAIEQSEAVVLLISPHALGSHQVTREVIRSYEHNKRFIPVLRDITHTEFQNRQPEWREAVGTATSIYLTQEGVAGIIDRIKNGLKALGIQPMDQPDATRIEQIRKLLSQLQTRGVPEQAAMATGAILVPLETTRPTEATTPALRKAPAKVKAPAALKVRPSLFWVGLLISVLSLGFVTVAIGINIFNDWDEPLPILFSLLGIFPGVYLVWLSHRRVRHGWFWPGLVMFIPGAVSLPGFVATWHDYNCPPCDVGVLWARIGGFSLPFIIAGAFCLWRGWPRSGVKRPRGEVSAFISAICVVCIGFALAMGVTAGGDIIVTYKVGALFSTTGGASNLGVPEQNTVNMVVDQINDAGGINGHPLEVIVYNDETNSEKCVTLATKLIEQDEVLAIIGPTTSGNSLAILDTITTAEIPLVSCAANIGIVEPVGERYWIFKTPQTDKEAIAEIYAYLASMDISDIAIISNTSGFGATGRAILLDDADDYGITVVDDQVFNEGDTSVQSQLTHIGGTDAEAVVCWDTDKGSAIVALDMDTLQMEMTLYCSHGIANMNFITSAGDAANGVIFPAGKLVIVDDIPVDDLQKGVLTTYRDDYEVKYGIGTISTFGGHAWDALQMVVMALEDLEIAEPYESADLLADARADIRDSIEEITNFYGVSGIFDMSPTNHLGMRPGSLAMIEIVDGEWTWSSE